MLPRVGSGGVPACYAPPPLPRPHIHYDRLPNGLTLLLRESHLAPVVNLQVWAGVGSADEGDEERGLAHFHEHMLFKGTERRGVGAVAGDVEGAGGQINAYTSFDVTVYYATLPSEALAAGVDVLADAVRHSIFDPHELKREREVVLEEIRRSQDTPGHVLGELAFREAYRAHPYRKPILGSLESVASFDRERVLRFFRRWYAADNLVWVAAGDFDARELAAEIARAFEGAQPAGAHRARPHEPPHAGATARVLHGPFEGHRIELCWPAGRFREREATHLDLLSFLLAECESSRLVQRLREREGLVDRVESSSWTPLDRGLMSVSLELDAERAEAAVEAVAEEMERLRLEPVSPDELERARTNFLASEHFERESVSGLASKLGSFEVLGGDWRGEERYIETLRTASAEDLLQTARNFLQPDQLALAALYPGEPSRDEDERTEKTRTPTDEERALLEAVARGVARARTGPAATAPPARARSASTHKHDAPPNLRRDYTLPGGAALHVLTRPAIPVVALRAAVRGGLLAEDEQCAGIGSFLASLWTRGTKTRTQAEFARAAEDLAAEIHGFSGRSSLGLTLEVTSDRLESALDLFAEALCQPGLASEALENERRETLAAIDRREDQLAQRAFMLFAQAEFERHPYRLPLLGERASVERFDCAQLRAHHARLLRAPELVLAASGDVDPDALAEGLARRLAPLPDTPRDTALALDPDPLQEGVREVSAHKPRAQAHLVLGFRGLTLGDPDRFALELISQILAGQGGRLFLELRDRQSLAYAVSAMNVEGLAPGYFAVYIASAPEKQEQARRGILLELEHLLQQAPSADELDRSRRHLLGAFAVEQQRNAARAAHMGLDALYGLGADASRRYSEELAAVTTDDLLRVARRVLRLDAYTLARVCPES